MYDVIVIGGGAAGMMAAIAAAREKASVLILEHMELCGKKILSTGNGRCNYTNKMQGIEYYRGDDPAFVLPALESFGCEQTIRFFSEYRDRTKGKERLCLSKKHAGGFRTGSTFVRTSQTEGKNRIRMRNPADITEKRKL